MSVVIIILLKGFARDLSQRCWYSTASMPFLYSAGYQNPHNNLKSYARCPTYKRLDACCTTSTKYISPTIVEHLKKKHHVEMDKHKRSSGKVWI